MHGEININLVVLSTAPQTLHQKLHLLQAVDELTCKVIKCTMLQSRQLIVRLSPRSPGFSPRVLKVGFVMEKVAPWQTFL
jgi:hypothetical protein